MTDTKLEKPRCRHTEGDKKCASQATHCGNMLCKQHAPPEESLVKAEHLAPMGDTSYIVHYEWKYDIDPKGQRTALHVTCNGKTLSVSIPKSTDFRGMAHLLVEIRFSTGGVNLKIGMTPVGKSSIPFKEAFSP